MASPFCIAAMIRYFESMGTTPVSEAYTYAALCSASVFSIAFNHHYYVYRVQRVGWHMRAAACALMYKKVCDLYIT